MTSDTGHTHDTEDGLPPLPAPKMCELNPYILYGDAAVNPYPGERELRWFNADQMHSYALAATASLRAEAGALRRALITVAASHAWLAFGDCRAFDRFGHSGPPLPANQADAMAKAALDGARPEADSEASLRAENEALREAAWNYMAAFGQGLEAHGISCGTQQVEADRELRAALDAARQEAP